MSNQTTKPIIFRLENSQDLSAYNSLLESNPSINIFNTIEDQLIDLYKVRNPHIAIVEKNNDYFNFVEDLLKGSSIDAYGAWVYYPWGNRLVHLLDESEFFEVRTNRNNNKISVAEQIQLKEKTVGIIGLSVGQSVAMTIAMERVAGRLRLADFDTIELSNLNRIRTSVHNLGVSKVVAVAREIAEIDPYLEVDIFPEGLNASNMHDFLCKEGKLDVLVELCDSIDIKVACRIAAKEKQIPVIMETNDRCMLDIERFDVEPNRAILHGLVSEEEVANLSDLSPAERINVILKIVDQSRLSSKMLTAFSQMGKTIRSWPQLASSVTMGGGITTDIVRRILLGEECQSGRWYFDIDEFINKGSVVFTD